MIEAYCNTFRNYANFSGRTSRKEFWSFFLVQMLIGIALSIVDGGFLTGGILYWIYCLASMIPALAAQCRRLQDTGHSGWLLLLYFTGIRAIPLIIWMVQLGTEGSNKYGPAPNRGYGSISEQPGYRARPADRAGAVNVACIAGSLSGRVYPIGGNEIVFGRDRSAWVCFPDNEPGVSRVHCKLFRGSNGQIMLMDCSSTYGTYLSGVGRLPPQQPTVVQKNATFYLGSKKVGFRLQ